MAPARLKDVAHRAQVSVAAASLALSGKGRISAEVRERVRSAADALSYRVDSPSRPRLPRAAVGILHAYDRDYEAHFVRPTLAELERELLGSSHLPVAIPFSVDEAPERQARRVLETGVSGVFSVQLASAAVLGELAARGLTVVVVNNAGFQDRFHSVCVDDYQGAYEGTRYLLGLGHRTVAFVEYERPESPAVVADRFVGFRKALEEAGVSFGSAQRVTIPFMDAAVLRGKLAPLFKAGGRPTAVFAHDDYLGLFVIEALADLGLSVPGDVSLLAPGDVLDYGLPRMPQITTMRIDTSLLGRIAANLMRDRLSARDQGVHVLKVKEQLVRRSTCRHAGEGSP